MRDSGKMVSEKGMGHFILKMVQNMLANGKMMKWMVMVPMFSVMETNMKDYF